MAEAAENVYGGSLGEQAIAAVDSGEVEPGADLVAADSVDGGEAEPSSGEEHTADELSDLERFFSDDDSEKPAEVADEQGSDKQGSGGRAEKRIRALNSRLKEQASRNDRLEQYMQQMQQQHQRELAMLREQSARMDERFRTLGPQKEPDPVEQFRADLLREARQQVGGELNPQIQQALQRLQQYEQKQETDRRMAETRANATRLNQMADAAVDKFIVPKVGEVDPADRDFFASMVLATKAMRRTDVESAAKIVRSHLNGYARKSIKHGYKAKGDKLRQSQQSAETTPSGRANASGDSYPSWDKLRAAGYRSYHQWELRGRPAIP